MHFDWAIAFCLLLVVGVLAAASVRELARWIWPYLRAEEERGRCQHVYRCYPEAGWRCERCDNPAPAEWFRIKR